MKISKNRRSSPTTAYLRFIFCLLPVSILTAQEKPVAVTPFVNIISSARTYTSPFAQDPSGRNASTDFSAFLTGRIAFSWSFSANGRLQASAEYLGSEEEREDYNGTIFREGFSMGAFELCVQYVLPFSGRRFLLFMGGGGGLYAGARTHALADAVSKAETSSVSAGILAVFGMEYFLSPAVSAIAEIRYRDPQIHSRNAFERPSVVSNGITYPLERRPFDSRINVNGNVYSLGLSFHF